MKRALIAAAMMWLAGCAVQTKPVHLQLPEADRVSGDLKPMVIDSITDVRNLSQGPDGDGRRLQPTVVTQLGEKTKMAIGAVNSHARWTWVLADNQTVADQMELLVGQVLAEHGYHAIPAAGAPADAPHMSIKVTEFWLQQPFNVGRVLTWTQQMKAWVATDVQVTTAGRTRSFHVSGKGANIVQQLSDENVRETYESAMSDYARNLGAKLFSSI